MSLLLILVAVVLLGAGLARGDNVLLIGSIAASLLAAIALLAGARQAGAAPEEEPDELGTRPGSEHGDEDYDRAPTIVPVRVGARPAQPPTSEDPTRVSVAPGIPVRVSAMQDADGDDDEDPPDEPPAQQVTPADAARVARLTIEVLVVDGRPRYHLAGCQHLLDRDSEPLPVSEAVELGFTPCSLCEPDTGLLAEAGRS
jgi:hypothetical protein